MNKQIPLHHRFCTVFDQAKAHEGSLIKITGENLHCKSTGKNIADTKGSLALVIQYVVDRDVLPSEGTNKWSGAGLMIRFRAIHRGELKVIELNVRTIEFLYEEKFSYV
jgi:hypothetical protein